MEQIALTQRAAGASDELPERVHRRLAPTDLAVLPPEAAALNDLEAVLRRLR